MQAPHVQRDDDAGFRIPKLAKHLLLGIERIDVNHDTADLEYRVVADYEVRTVRQKEANPVTLADPKLLKALGGTIDEATDLAIAVFLSKKFDTAVVRKFGYGLI